MPSLANAFAKLSNLQNLLKPWVKKRTLVALVSLMLVKCAAKHATLMACSLVGKH